MRGFLAKLALLMGLALPQLTLAEGRSIIVLDASGSMWGQIDGRTKIDIAREALASAVAELPADTEMGLMAYGHREKGSCDDIELIVEPGKGTGPAILAAANALQFKGKTPLTESVRRAATALRSTEEKATVILITDGIETCEADPCALGAELEASGVDFTAHVVGFGLTADEGKKVACLAEETGGSYVEAGDLASLTLALQTTVIEAVVEPQPEPATEPAPAPEPAALEHNFAPTGLLAPGVAKPDDGTDFVWEIHEMAADGTTGPRITTCYNACKELVEPGKYRLLAILGQVQVEQDLILTADTLAAPEVIFNAARLFLTPKIATDAAENSDAAVQYVQDWASVSTTVYGPRQVYLPAGDVLITASLGQASVSETLTLAPGDLIERDIVIGAGLAVISSFYVEGMAMEDVGQAVEVLQAKKALDGSRKSLTTSYGEAEDYDLPPGDYIARVAKDAASVEVPFTVKTGERVDVTAILNAGVLAVSAPGASKLEVFSAKKDINGDRKSLAYDYGEELNKTMSAGDYIIVTERGDVATETPATVTAGERTEITVP